MVRLKLPLVISWAAWLGLTLYPATLAAISGQSFHPLEGLPYYAIMLLMLALIWLRGRGLSRAVGAIGLGVCTGLLAFMTFFDIIVLGLSLLLILLSLMGTGSGRGRAGVGTDLLQGTDDRQA